MSNRIEKQVYVSSDQFQDQIRYCEHCGISFLWPAEEQRAGKAGGAPVPDLCAGCRSLLPPAGRERGLVKWFNHRKRYGFIIRKEQPELFVHGSDLPPNIKLQPGDLVEYSVGAGERGPTAKEVRLLGHFEEPVA
jgi:CspA family cold shock protein